MNLDLGHILSWNSPVIYLLKEIFFGFGYHPCYYSFSVIIINSPLAVLSNAIDLKFGFIYLRYSMRINSCSLTTFQVHLTLETGIAGTLMDSEVPRTRPTAPVSQLVRLLWGEDTTELQMSVAHVPHIAMYLSLRLDSESPQEEVSGAVVFNHLCTFCEQIRREIK